MPDTNTANTPQASEITGTVTILYGTGAKAIGPAPDHLERILQLDGIEAHRTVYPHETIVTDSDTSLSIVFNDPANTQLDVPRSSEILIDDDVIGTPVDGSEVAGTPQDIQQLFEDPEFDPTTDLPAAASGGQGQSDGGGHGTINFDLDGNEVYPEATFTPGEFSFTPPEFPDFVFTEPAPEPVPEPPVPEPPAPKPTAVAPVIVSVVVEDIPPPPPPPPPPSDPQLFVTIDDVTVYEPNGYYYEFKCEGEIDITPGSTESNVDLYYFWHQGGALDISVTSVNVDTEVHLYLDDGNIDTADLISSNADPVTNNSAIQETHLDPGSYVVAVSNEELTTGEANSGINSNTSAPATGTYDLTMAGDIYVDTTKIDPTYTQSTTFVPDPDEQATAVFTVSLVDENGNPVTATQNVDVTYTTNEISPIPSATQGTPAGNDYDLATGTVTIPIGSQSTTVAVQVNVDDEYNEGIETYTVDLTGATGAEIDGEDGTGADLQPVPDGIGIGTIIDEGEDESPQ